MEAPNTPPVEEKIWGVTRTVIKGPVLIFHASIVKGGYCSRHYHATRVNHFYVLSGQLHIVLYACDEEQTLYPRETIVLGPGQALSVDPGVIHRFEAAEATELLETYWGKLDIDDIVRHDVGGRDCF